MKTKLAVALLTIMTVGVACPHFSRGAEKVKSLRGLAPIPGPSLPSVAATTASADQPIPRSFVHQPPLIPHDSEDYVITLEKNDCLECHGRKDNKATRPDRSHYLDRDGKEMAEITSRWYFCSQCHVRQDETKPLVGNTFKP
jgi:cytochrome c-type protein NapB